MVLIQKLEKSSRHRVFSIILRLFELFSLLRTHSIAWQKENNGKRPFQITRVRHGQKSKTANCSALLMLDAPLKTLRLNMVVPKGQFQPGSFVSAASRNDCCYLYKVVFRLAGLRFVYIGLVNEWQDR